jgi:hypothetical protein
MRSAVRQGIHMIDRGEIDIEESAAIDAAAAAIAHRGAFQ